MLHSERGGGAREEERRSGWEPARLVKIANGNKTLWRGSWQIATKKLILASVLN